MMTTVQGNTMSACSLQECLDRARAGKEVAECVHRNIIDEAAGVITGGSWEAARWRTSAERARPIAWESWDFRPL